MSKNTVSCPACKFASAVVKESGKGGMSVHCSDCGYQGFARTPKAAAALRAQLGGDPALAPGAGKKSTDDIFS